jgi:hypothetical protein
VVGLSDRKERPTDRVDERRLLKGRDEKAPIVGKDAGSEHEGTVHGKSA